MRQPWRNRWLGLGLSGVLVLSGCGALQFRTSAQPGGPMQVGVTDTPGPSPTPTPTPTEDPLPEGMRAIDADLGSECPMELEVAVPDHWGEPSGSTAFLMVNAPGSPMTSPKLTISCRPAFSNSATEAVNSARNYRYNGEGSKIEAEKKGQFGNGYYWSYQAALDAKEIMAMNQEATAAIGSEIALTAQGKLYTLTVEGQALERDLDGTEQLHKILETVKVDGSQLPVPDFVP